MKKNFINFAIVFALLSLCTRQCAYGAIDIAEFKKIKNIKTHFASKQDKPKKKKNIKLEETTLDRDVFSSFEDEENDTFVPSSLEKKDYDKTKKS